MVPQSQFKSKTLFCDAKYSKKDVGFPVEKHFFRTRLGKGPCDGEFGVVKRSASNAVTPRQAVIKDATDFYYYVKTNLTKTKENEGNKCNHSMRTFLYLEENKIKRNRPNHTVGKSNTRKLHAVRANTETNELQRRLLSWFCSFWVKSEGDKCQNDDYVDN
ncbi:Hypothetical predicted protein [Mytilus galloprovincialis]|uniref:Uncharacterized protein n=1 Tax=Mytilus galloprovincialis TaxID=29158 RepID=A0A8B6G2K8_MYTGA|nr:Hypothetical predicted protein [Mytilus galloprovincialis]